MDNEHITMYAMQDAATIPDVISLPISMLLLWIHFFLTVNYLNKSLFYMALFLRKTNLGRNYILLINC